MNQTRSPNRRPAGTPAGGQFAPAGRPESHIDLTVARDVPAVPPQTRPGYPLGVVTGTFAGRPLPGLADRWDDAGGSWVITDRAVEHEDRVIAGYQAVVGKNGSPALEVAVEGTLELTYYDPYREDREGTIQAQATDDDPLWVTITPTEGPNMHVECTWYGPAGVHVQTDRTFHVPDTDEATGDWSSVILRQIVPSILYNDGHREPDPYDRYDRYI